MTLIAKQQQLIDRYEILPGAQERLNALVDVAGQRPALDVSEKIEDNRVQGCQSRVYVVGILSEGHCQFRCEADSVLVKGLVVLLCDLYSGGTPDEVIQLEPEILVRLGIWSILSPTRQRGLSQVRLAIRQWAEGFSGRHSRL